METVYTVHGYLGNLQQLEFVLEHDESPSLHVRPRLVRHLHHKLGGLGPGWGVEQEVEYVEVHCGTQVVNVGDEDELFALFDEFFQETRSLEGSVHVTVTWWVPAVCVCVCGVGGC